MFSSEVQEQANAWITMTRVPEDECPEEVFEAGFDLNVKAIHQPVLAWQAILMIVNMLSETDLIQDKSDARKIAANLGAGPLETLLSRHGEAFINELEEKADACEALKWVIGSVWKNSISDDVWFRLRRAAVSTAY